MKLITTGHPTAAARAALVTALVISCLAARAAAQQPGVGVSPVVVEETVAKGSAHVIKFQVTNNTSHPQRVRCSVRDVGYAGGRRTEAEPGTLPRSASSWLRFNPAELVVPPSGTATVEAVVSVPQSASGSYYTMPSFDISRDGGAATQNASAGFVFRIRGRIVLTTPDSTPSLSVVGVKVEPPTATKPLTLSLEMMNTGNAHVVPSPTFTLLDRGGRLVGRGQMPTRKLMPGEKATAEGTWAGELRPGNYHVLTSVTYKTAGQDKAVVVKEVTFAVP